MTARWRSWKTRPQLRPDWDRRFAEWLEASRSRPHQYGRFDCLMQVAEAIEAQTGRDFAAGHRGKYKSGRGSARYLRELGFRSPAALLDSILDPVPPAFAQRGDIVLVKVPGEQGIPGVCIGGEALLLRHDEPEPVRVPRSHWTKAWSVGRRVAGAG